ncbi:MAG TPA: hypothetical protein ENG67_04710 [candidate division WOR-3 bacterium]|uniref:Cytochrome c assembly protein domain-containing protein n=1 Tax=candidate division WOR-3 bacterium TaxID=2052148 RepID=A0A7C1BC62_UNCW3|nr:hypothetical protein [candidate division WOR-3 bacterium]
MEVNVARVGLVFYFLYFLWGRRGFLIAGAVLNCLYFPFLFVNLGALVLPGLRELLAVTALLFSVLLYFRKKDTLFMRFLPMLILSLSLVLTEGGLHSPMDFIPERSLFILFFGASLSFYLMTGSLSLHRVLRGAEETGEFDRYSRYGLFFLGFSLVFGGISDLRIYGSPFLWDPRVLLVVGLFLYYATLHRLRLEGKSGLIRHYLYVFGMLILAYALLGALYSPVSYRLI